MSPISPAAVRVQWLRAYVRRHTHRGSHLLDHTEDTTAAADYHDGELLPMDAIAVRPCCEEDLATLVASVPVSLAGELARLAAWRAMGMQAPPPAGSWL